MSACVILLEQRLGFCKITISSSKNTLTYFDFQSERKFCSMALLMTFYLCIKYSINYPDTQVSTLDVQIMRNQFLFNMFIQHV